LALAFYIVERNYDHILGNTPLHLAVTKHFFNLDIAKELIKYGASIYLQNNEGFSSLNYCSELRHEQLTIVDSILTGKSVLGLLLSLIGVYF
jgi:ankyrin repeat protein